jgi:hypothetical protein
MEKAMTGKFITIQVSAARACTVARRTRLTAGLQISRAVSPRNKSPVSPAPDGLNLHLLVLLLLSYQSELQQPVVSLLLGRQVGLSVLSLLKALLLQALTAMTLLLPEEWDFFGDKVQVAGDSK